MAISSSMVLLICLIFWILLNLMYVKRNKIDKKNIGEGNGANENDNNYTTGLKTYYGVFGILRTSWGLKTIDIIGKYSIWRKIGIFLIPMCVIISIITFYMFISSTLSLFNGTIPKESSKPIIFLFGNVIPWIPGVIALIIGITFHELAHGIVARSFNLKIKSTGLLLALGIPLGAFVEIGDEFKNASKKVRGAVASAGPIANVVIFMIVMLITPYFHGLSTPLTITEVLEDHPASGVLMSGDIVYSINGKRINSLLEFYNTARELGPKEKITLKVLRNNQLKTLELITSPEGKIGIIVEPSNDLMFILQLLYWTSMLNLMLGFFNLLPAIPLDGFHVWNALPEIIKDLRKNNNILNAISKYMEYIINEKSLTTISMMVWLMIFASIMYSFL
ncbi:site-2 protease family protein [Methanothermococcus sp. SCGC AD-155-M21]|nr:site-2 protease family protein [Methanothermococcus sp. SCGC AD-155-M21]